MKSIMIVSQLIKIKDLVEEIFKKSIDDNYNKGFYYQYTEKLKGDLNEN